MKNVAIFVLFLAFSVQAAEKITVETIVTCQEGIGEQWIQAGVVLNDGPGYRLLVVSHNTEDGTSKIISNRLVSEKRIGIVSFFEDDSDTVRLRVRGDKGELSVIKFGPGSFSKDNLTCYPHSSLSFDKK